MEKDVKRVNGRGGIVVNDNVYVVKGKILDNPFIQRIENSEAAFWMLSNRERVMVNIEQKFREYGVRGGNADDCFNMMINEFNTRTDLQFNKNYFGKKSGYTVEEYVLNRVKHMVHRYRNLLNKEDSVPLLTSDESERYYHGVAEEVIEGNNSIDDIIESDVLYWDAVFKDLLGLFTFFLQERSYKKLDYELVMAHLYFNVETETEHIDVTEHYERVAKNSNETIEVVITIVEDMVKAVKEGDKVGVEILRVVQELIEGKKHGWRPKRLREK